MSQFWPYLAMAVLIGLLWLWERSYPGAVTRFEENLIATLLATMIALAG